MLGCLFVSRNIIAYSQLIGAKGDFFAKLTGRCTESERMSPPYFNAVVPAAQIASQALLEYNPKYVAR